MNKTLLKSGVDFSIFTAFNLIIDNPYLKQFFIAIAGAIGIAFTNYILIPLINYLFKNIKSKIKNNNKIPDDLEDKFIEGIDKIEKEVTEKVEDLIDKE